MGYYSTFYINVKNSDGTEVLKEELDDIVVSLNNFSNDLAEEFIESITGDEFDGSRFFYYAGSQKWYDYNDEMKEFSERKPFYIFEIVRDGEESGDLEKRTYENGIVKKYKTKITFVEV